MRIHSAAELCTAAAALEQIPLVSMSFLLQLNSTLICLILLFHLFLIKHVFKNCIKIL